MDGITHDLLREIENGRVVLFLGSGASIGAIHPSGATPPTSKELAKKIAYQFLGPDFVDRPLSNVAELAVSETNIKVFQKFIADIFEPFQPADFHRIIPKLVWKAIASTNFDLIIERAYQESTKPLQRLEKFVKNGKPIDLHDTDLMFLKLHGCINDIYDESTPLILSTDQYVNFRKNRSRLFDRLKELFYDFPFVFAGYSLQDYDLRTIMLELTKDNSTSFPRSYLVAPDLSEQDVHFFETKRITHINATFEKFLIEIDGAVPSQFRILKTLQDSNEHPIIKKLSLGSGNKLSPNITTLVTRDTDYVYPEISPTEFDCTLFYKGHFPDWTPIIIDLDVPRRITTELLTEIFLESIDRDLDTPEFFTLKGPAGSGKSVVLRRLAWNAAKDLDFLCLWLKRGKIPSYEALLELFRLSSHRIFLFIDPVTDYIETIQELMIRALKDKLPLTIISSERDHEWNIECDELEPYLTKEFKLRNLNTKEIDKLIDLLGKNSSLGYLEDLPLDKQREMLTQHAGRQLLVALHEATFGKPFGDIIQDEYNSITPLRAQSLYLTVCIFHRLGVPIRAGLISRIHQIPFTMFEEDLFNPLESVVFTYFDQRIQDHVYHSRHPHIAEIVFERVLKNKQDRLDEYMRIIAEIDYDYDSDREAFHRIIRARDLTNLFPDPNTIRNLYDKAKERVGNQPWLLQQEAIFEMNCNNGDLEKAHQSLELANRLSPKNRMILHSLSELSLKRSEKSKNSVEKAKLREDARRQSIDLIHSGQISSYPYHTLIKTHLNELIDSMEEGEDLAIGRVIKKLEETIDEATQKYPEDSFIASAESDFLKVINENEKALNALLRAFKINEGSPFIATRLANVYESQGEIDKAISVLESCLTIQPQSKIVNFRLAKLLQTRPDYSIALVKHYLSQSFTEGDANYVAQFEFARVLYLDKDDENANRIFQKLKYSNIDPKIKNLPRGTVISPNGEQTIFTGTLVQRESTYGFIKRDQFADELFTHKSFSNETDWDNLSIGGRCQFNLAFNYKGAIAINLKCK